jgi:hypothetical protein
MRLSLVEKGYKPVMKDWQEWQGGLKPDAVTPLA